MENQVVSTIVLSYRDVVYDHNDGGDTKSVRQLLVDIAQDAAGGIKYVSDDEFREQPVRRHGRIQLCKQIQDESLNLKLEVLTLR
jgi:hypothetical protein